MNIQSFFFPSLTSLLYKWPVFFEGRTSGPGSTWRAGPVGQDPLGRQDQWASGPVDQWTSSPGSTWRYSATRIYEYGFKRAIVEWKLPDQHLLHVDTMTLQQEVEKHPGYLAVPQPLESLPEIQILRPQVWIDNCLMQPTLISYPTFPVTVSSCQVPSGFVLIQLSPVIFTVTTINQVHPPPEAYMTSMPEQDWQVLNNENKEGQFNAT